MRKLHIAKYTIAQLDCIYIDSIETSEVIDGSYYDINQNLVEDIYNNPEKYKPLFENVANLKILNYLEDCHRMDFTPYQTNYNLIEYLDNTSFIDGIYRLSDVQFRYVVKNFQSKTRTSTYNEVRIKQLCMNVLSIHTAKGLYVLAYRKLELDVKNKVFRPNDDITICTEFTMNGIRESIRKYLDADDYDMLNSFEENQEEIKNKILKRNDRAVSVDDMPYLIGLEKNILVDLHKEYSAIIDMYEEEKVTTPINAFFGDLVKRPIRRKEYPMALINKRVNLDQLLAINNAMKYPVAYIQGPPGTGKTNTIINTISTAFFNEKTVLFTSYNNHPIDSVFEKLSSIKYRDKVIPFPIIRLGNNDKIVEAIRYMKDIYARTIK